MFVVVQISQCVKSILLVLTRTGFVWSLFWRNVMPHFSCYGLCENTEHIRSNLKDGTIFLLFGKHLFRSKNGTDESFFMRGSTNYIV